MSNPGSDGVDFKPPASGDDSTSTGASAGAFPTPDLIPVFIRRALQSDFQKNRASDPEREMLAGAARPVADELAQDYAAWRRGTLWFAAAMMGITSVVKLFDWLGTMTTDFAAEGWPQDAANVAMLIETLGFLPYPLCTFLIVVAVMNWTDLARSRHLLRIGWAVLFLTPFVLAIIPWGLLVNESVRGAVGGLLAIVLLLALAPPLVGLTSGAVRATLTIKTLIPEAQLSGWATVFVAPFSALLWGALFVINSQALQHFMGGLGLLALTLAPFVYIWHFRDLTRPHSTDEVSALIGKIRLRSLFLTGGGVLILSILLFSNGGVGILDVLPLIIGVFASVLTLAVVASDFLLGALHAGYRQTKGYIGSELEAAADRKFSGIAAAGLTDLPAIRLPAFARAADDAASITVNPAPPGDTGADQTPE